QTWPATRRPSIGRHGWVAPSEANYSGALYYRTPVPVVVTISQLRASSGYQPIDGAIVMLPQAGPITYIPMNSSAFVRTVNDVQFTDGMISSWNAERPSEVASVVRIPIRVLTEVMQIPAQVLQYRVNLSSSQQDLRSSQNSEMEYIERLRVRDRCLVA